MARIRIEVINKDVEDFKEIGEMFLTFPQILSFLNE